MSTAVCCGIDSKSDPISTFLYTLKYLQKAAQIDIFEFLKFEVIRKVIQTDFILAHDEITSKRDKIIGLKFIVSSYL